MDVSHTTVQQYYGTLEQFTDESYQYILVCDIPRNAVRISEFLTTDNAELYNAHHTEIKDLIKHLHLE
jgi:hypothetical protein